MVAHPVDQYSTGSGFGAVTMKFEIDDEAINDLMRDSMLAVIKRAAGAHYTNIEMRINGKDERHEADWIKHLQVVD